MKSLGRYSSWKRRQRQTNEIWALVFHYSSFPKKWQHGDLQVCSESAPIDGWICRFSSSKISMVAFNPKVRNFLFIVWTQKDPNLPHPGSVEGGNFQRLKMVDERIILKFPSFFLREGKYNVCETDSTSRQELFRGHSLTLMEPFERPQCEPTGPACRSLGLTQGWVWLKTNFWHLKMSLCLCSLGFHLARQPPSPLWFSLPFPAFLPLL